MFHEQLRGGTKVSLQYDNKFLRNIKERSIVTKESINYSFKGNNNKREMVYNDQGQ